MSSPAPSVGTRRSQSRSPRRTPQSSPPRRPLHERSDSETNASHSPVRDPKGQEEPVALKIDPFPRLPSQILSPRQGPYIFEDETASLAAGPSRYTSIPIPKTKSPRRGRSNSPASSNKGPRLTHASRLPRLSAPPVLKPSVSVSSTFSSLRTQSPSVKRLKEKYEGLGNVPTLEERPSRRQLYSPTLRETHVEPLPPPLPETESGLELEPSFEPKTDDETVVQSELASAPEDEDMDETVIVAGGPSELDTQLSTEPPLETEEEKGQPHVEPPTEAQINLAKVLQDAHRARIRRSPSVDSIKTRREVLQDAERSHLRRSPSVDSIRTTGTGKAKAQASDEELDGNAERPRSATTPAAATDALLRALIESGENIQYPQIRKPSATSLRTDASSIRRAYPPPLRLRRKRAYSDISAELTPIDPSPTSTATPIVESAHPIRPQPSYQSFTSRVSFTSSSVHAPAPLRVTNLTYHDTWEEELDDTVSELQPQALKRQRSGYYATSISDLSRPTSSSSMRSSRVAFYHFLNDSHTAWARFYYRGEGRLQSVTPPMVTEVTPPHTPRGSSIFRRVSSKRSKRSRSDSPGSAGFPESLYVPRLRPLQTELEDVTIISDGTSLVVLPPHTSSEDAEDVIEEEMPQPANYVPDIPYLSPCKRKSEQHEPGWIAPSMDESCGLLTRVNRQIALFSLGFIFPFAWIFASFLALPACPDWRSNTPNFETVFESYGPIQTQQDLITAELYESFELRRFKKAHWWRRANRYMSLVGICIIIIVIIASTVTATT